MKRFATNSLWCPLQCVFLHSGMWVGYWTPYCEAWFQHCNWDSWRSCWTEEFNEAGKGWKLVAWTALLHVLFLVHLSFMFSWTLHHTICTHFFTSHFLINTIIPSYVFAIEVRLSLFNSKWNFVTEPEYVYQMKTWKLFYNLKRLGLYMFIELIHIYQTKEFLLGKISLCVACPLPAQMIKIKFWLKLTTSIIVYKIPYLREYLIWTKDLGKIGHNDSFFGKDLLNVAGIKTHFW